MTTLTTDDLRDALHEAQEHLRDAIRLIETYVNATDDRNAEAYLLDHLRIFAGRDHGYLSRDLNLDDLIKRLDDRETGDEAAEEEDDSPFFYTPDGQRDVEGSGDIEDNDTTEQTFRTSTGERLYWSNSIQGYVTIPMDED